MAKSVLKWSLVNRVAPNDALFRVQKRSSSSLTTSTSATTTTSTPDFSNLSNESAKKRFETASERVFKDKSTKDILTAYLVFKLCKLKFLVENNERLMKLGYSVLGASLFEKLMKMTFYGQFVGGENEKSLKPLVASLERNGIGAIFDYAVEKDISKDEAVEIEMDACVSENERDVIAPIFPETTKTTEINRDSKFLAHQTFGDRREKVVSARTYFYEDEKQCDENVEIFLRCIDMASKCSKDGFAAIKLTSLGRPQFLMQLSEVLSRTRQFFDRISGVYPGDVMRRNICIDQFEIGLKKLGVQFDVDDANAWFTILDTNQDGTFDLLDWNSLVSPESRFSKLLVAPDANSGEMKRLIEPLSDNEEEQMKNMLGRLDVLASAAKNCNVKLMIDAEQTYFQPAISRLVMELMKVYNVDQAVIYNTYQCYLKEAFNYLSTDMSFAERQGFHFGGKIVRGAYLEFERKRAAEIGYKDPISPTYEATTRMYERVVGECLTAIAADRKVSIMVASHNEESVNFTTERMNQLGIFAEDKLVYFGQLLGMCDRLTFRLGHAGYPVYKYVPFGPVKEVLPYLSRRAHENSSMLAHTDKEVKLLINELKYRMSGRK